ncbi:MAG: hypothetical protein FWG29_03530 [Treponema sp.]|nr:hypothetical protein [Treponema sp.]
MDKKGGIQKKQKLTLEEKISMLSETEEAYVLGFIEGALMDEHRQEQNNPPKILSRQKK